MTQYDLMRAIAGSVRCITIVGDPDQSSEFALFTSSVMPMSDVCAEFMAGGLLKSRIWPR